MPEVSSFNHFINKNFTVSVVIVNYNRCDDLRNALHSIRTQDLRPLEVIVVDNASSDDSNSMLKSEFPEVKLLPLERNIGMDGYSVGCREARGDIIFQMDNDSLMPQDTVLSQVVDAFRHAPPKTAIIAAYVAEYREGKTTVEELRGQECRTGLIESFGYHAGGVAFNRQLMNQVGYYNEDVFLYGAELFVQLQAISGGFRIIYAPEIFMLHKASGVARSTRGVYYEIRNRYWCIRHFGTLSQCLRYFPFMLLHDGIYSVYRGAFYIGLRGMRDGFLRLPESLHKPSSIGRDERLRAVDFLGRSFGIRRLFSLVVSKILGRKTTARTGKKPSDHKH